MGCVAERVEYEKQNRGTREPLADGEGCEAHGAKMANGLDQQGDENAGEGRGVMRERPDDGENAETQGEGDYCGKRKLFPRKRDGGQEKRDLLMNAEITAAYRSKGWTVYGELGRQPLRAEGTRVDSFEHWVGFQSQKGFGFRAGRFLPAYGIHFSDHTAFNRKPLGLDTFDQVYGLELSHTTDRHLIQVTASPGRADSIIDNDGTRGFVGAARVQLDLSTRTVLVASGLFHDKSDLNPRDGSAGLALGFSPVRRLTIWTEGDAQFQQGLSGAPSYVLVNETGFEVYRGVWLKISPQLRTSFGDTSGGTFRWVFELNLMPRTHWNVDLSHYRDKGRSNDIVTRTTLLQLHLYL